MSSYFYRQATTTRLRPHAMKSKQKLNKNPDNTHKSGSNRSKNFFLQTIPLQIFGASAGPLDYLATNVKWFTTPQIFRAFQQSCRLSGRKIEIHGYFWQQMWQVLERGHTTCFLAWVIFSLVFLSENLTIFLSVFVHSMIKYCSKVKAVPLDT